MGQNDGQICARRLYTAGRYARCLIQHEYNGYLYLFPNTSSFPAPGTHILALFVGYGIYSHGTASFNRDGRAQYISANGDTPMLM